LKLACEEEFAAKSNAHLTKIFAELIDALAHDKVS
jgi:hypothetical protein